MIHSKNVYINPEKLPEIRKRNLVRFKQILDDLTDIYNRFEAGELDALWFIRRLNAAVLGCAWYTDEKGKRYRIWWENGKLIRKREEVTINLRVAYEHMRLSEQRLDGTVPIDAAEEERLRREGVVLS